MPAFDRRRRSPLRGRVATRARRRCDPFGFGRRCDRARTWPRERCLDRAAVSRTRVRRQAARPEKLQSALAANSFRLGRPAAERNSTLDAAARLGVRREAAVSRHQIEPLHAARLERQESHRPTGATAARLPGGCSTRAPPTGRSAPPLARLAPAASRRAAVSAPSARLPVLVRSGQHASVTHIGVISSSRTIADECFHDLSALRPDDSFGDIGIVTVRRCRRRSELADSPTSEPPTTTADARSAMACARRAVAEAPERRRCEEGRQLLAFGQPTDQLWTIG